MTRREEIENHIGYKITKAAVEYYQANCANDVDLLDAFEAGAEWMQETMIDKACKWLKEYGDDFGVPESESGRVYVDDLVCEFRKAMEE